MHDKVREKVMDLLRGYRRLQQEITILRYQLDHLPSISGDEVIASMNFSHGEGQVGPNNPGVSNKTQNIALNYQTAMDRENSEFRTALVVKIHSLEQQKDTLDRWINLLEKREADVIRLHYCEGKSWDRTSEEISLSSRTTYRLRVQAISELCRIYSTVFPEK